MCVCHVVCVLGFCEFGYLGGGGVPLYRIPALRRNIKMAFRCLALKLSAGYMAYKLLYYSDMYHLNSRCWLARVPS